MAIKSFCCFDTVLKLRSAAELERLIEVEILPSCDPRLSAAVPLSSVYFGVNEAVKIAIENAAEMPAQTLCQLKERSLRTVVRENSNMAGDDSAPNNQKGIAETGEIHKKSCASQNTQSHISSSKQTTLGSRKKRVLVNDADASCAAESVNENLVVAAAALREQPRASTDSIERGSKRSDTRVHVPRKRKRKVDEELAGYEDSFPSMSYLLYDELNFSYHLPQLSYFAVLDKNPDDPMLAISLCEIDDLTAFHQQAFISDLDSAFIGRKLRFTSVRSPYSDRTFSRLGHLSFQTYCDGHFIHCGSISHVHMMCLHQWALREPLEKILCNMWKDSQIMAVCLPYPSVCCVSDVCSWLSCQLCYLMSDMGIDCMDPPDIFIGSSVQSELTTNCLYRMFCHYVDFLCEKSDKYFRDVDYYKAVAGVEKRSDRAAETETYAVSGMIPARHKRVKRLKQASYTSRKKDVSKQTNKKSSSWQTDVDYDHEGMFFELDEHELFEVADLEHEMATFSDDHAKKATGYGHRKDYASAAHRKRKLPKDYYDDHDHGMNHDVQPKAKRVRRDHARLSARDRENDIDVHRKKRDRQRARRKDADAVMSTRDTLTSPSRYEDSPDFMLYDEDGNIVVRCSDTGHAIVVDAKSGDAMKHDELEPGVDTVPSSLSVVDEWYESSHQLYGVVHDHCYTAAPQCAVETVTPVVSDLDKEQNLAAAGIKQSNDNNSVLPVTPLKLTDAEEKNDAKDNTLTADGRKSELSLDHAVESTAKKMHPLAPLSVVSRAAVSEVNAKNTTKKILPLSAISTAAVPEANAESLRKSPEQPVTKKPEPGKKLVKPQPTVQKERLVDAEKNRDGAKDGTKKSIGHEKVERPTDAGKNRDVGEDGTKKSTGREKVERLTDAGKNRDVGEDGTKKSTGREKVERTTDAEKNRDVGEDGTKKSTSRERVERPTDAGKNRDVGEDGTKKSTSREKVERPTDAEKNRDVGKDGTKKSTSREQVKRPIDAEKNRDIGKDGGKKSTSREQVKRPIDAEKNHDVGEDRAKKSTSHEKVERPAGAAKNYDVGKNVNKEPVSRKKLVRPQETERLVDAQKNYDSKVNKSKTVSRTSDAAEVLRKHDSASVSASKKVGSPNENRPSAASEISTDASKMCTKKSIVPLENREKVSGEVAEVSAKIVEPEKASVDIGKISEVHTVSVDSVNKATDAQVSVETDKTASESQPSAAVLAAAARAASHYEDAYLSDMADAYGVWPSSNFDIAFDPTDIPGGHMYNPFRKTWPNLQHVIDGKTDLLLKVCSFPDVKSFSIRRVMRENGFLWAVCLTLFDPDVNKPDTVDSNSFPELDSNASNKVKGAKTTNSLMQAFRQAVEAKKKVAAKSKVAKVRQNSDDTAGTVGVWSAKRPSGKMAIVFGSAVKSGGSLSSVVTADQPAKRESVANTFNNLLTSAISKMNSDISDMISQKCGEQCLDKGAPTTECQSNLPVMSKHLNVLSDLTVDMYDIAEYKLEKIYATKDGDKMENIKKSENGNESAVASEASAVTITTVATATCQPHVSTSSSASNVISSSTLLPSVNASKTLRAEITPVSGPVSAATQVSQPSVSVTAVLTSTSTVVISGSAAAETETAALPVTVTVTASTVADMPPPPMPPLSLSRIGVGFEPRVSAVTISGGSGVSASWPSSSSASSASVSQNSLTCTAAYQATVGGFAYPSPVSSEPTPSVPAAFSNTTVPYMAPPTIPPNLYSMPPAVGIPLNVPPPGFLNTSIPPPPIPSCPPPPWYPPSSSAADGYSARRGTYPAVPVSSYQEMSNTAASCASASGSLQTPVTSVGTHQQNVTSVSYSSALPHRPDVLNNQRPPTTGGQLRPDSTATTARLVPEFLPRPPFPVGLGQGMPQRGLVSPAGLKSAASSLLQGNRPLGPLKPVTPETQSTAARSSVPVVRPVRPVSLTASAEIRTVSPQQNSNIQLRGIVSVTRPTSTATGLPVISQSNSVPMRPVTTSQPAHLSVGSSLVGQAPRGGVRPGPSVSQSSQSSQPAVPNSQPRAAVSQLVQSPRGAVRPGLPMNQSGQPVATSPHSQPRGPVKPIIQPIRPDNQPTAAGPCMGQSPVTAFRPRVSGPATSSNQMSKSAPLSLVSGTPRGPPVCAESQLPSNPARPAGVVASRPSRPLTAAGGGSAGQSVKGLLLTPNSRVYVLNSDSSPLCKDVKVSL